MDLIEAARQFIAIDSSSTCGTVDIAKFAKEICEQAGLHVQLEFETWNGVDQANLLARVRPDISPNEILLLTHLDTIEPGHYALWTRTGANPFQATIYQDAIYGLGSADVKLDFLCKLKALSLLQKSGNQTPFVLAGTFGKEQGMVGAIRLIRRKRISVKAALISEPTELKLMTSGKGMAAVEIEIPFSEGELRYRAEHDLREATTTQSRIFSGKAAHISAPHLGESAINKMFDYLNKLPSGMMIMEIEGGTQFNTVPGQAVLEVDMARTFSNSMSDRLVRILKSIAQVERDFANHSDSKFIPPVPTLNIGKIRTRSDHVELLGCCRLPPSVSQSTYESWMELLRRDCEQIGATFRVLEYKQSFQTAEASPLVEACRQQLVAMGKDARCHALDASTEASVFSRFGIDCVVVGPGRSVGNSHAPNEHVKIRELEDAVEFYKGVLERVAP